MSFARSGEPLLRRRNLNRDVLTDLDLLHMAIVARRTTDVAVDQGVAVVALGGSASGSGWPPGFKRELLKQTHCRKDRGAREDAYGAMVIARCGSRPRMFRSWIPRPAI
jgi:hypothetical protein